MDRHSDACDVPRAYVRFGSVYWTGVFLASLPFGALKSGVAQTGRPGVVEALVACAVCWSIACAISAALFRLHRRVARRGTAEGGLPVLVLSSFALSLVAALAAAGFGQAVRMVAPPSLAAGPDWNGFLDDTALGAALFFGWCCLFVGLVFGFELHERGLRLAAVREEALAAQMRALRYQVNPHFLFNTLNSVAGLVEEGSADRAGRMILGLSTFLRTTLALDPLQDVPLADELALQRDYLEIERERFSDRMTFAIDVADDVRSALVPSLILQPLVENAIRHGVGATVGSVEIALGARREGDRLEITIENDMPASGGAGSAGMGVGTRNVADRLRARFRDDGRLSAGPVEPGRFRAVMSLPWRTAVEMDPS